MPTRPARRYREKDAHCRNDAGDTPLLAAIRQCDTDHVKRLINSRSVKIANKHDGATPLMAVLYLPSPHNIALIRRMLEEGADVNAVDDDGTSVIFHVPRDDRIAYRMLIAAGANIDQESLSCSCRHTLLIGAVQSNSPDHVRLYIELGADVNYPGTHGRPLEQATKRGFEACADVLSAAGAH